MGREGLVIRILFLDLGADYMSVQVFKNMSCVLVICVLLYTTGNTSIKSLKKCNMKKIAKSLCYPILPPSLE